SKDNTGGKLAVPDSTAICTTSTCPKVQIVGQPILAKQLGHEKVRVVEKRFARSMETPLQSEFHSGEFTLTERVKSSQHVGKQQNNQPSEKQLDNK
ncbi:hypothetical protein L9F63_025522, partial [Diploptera punctata]